jgi:hypothetical protein
MDRQSIKEEEIAVKGEKGSENFTLGWPELFVHYYWMSRSNLVIH